MDFNAYQASATKTASYSKDDADYKLMYLCLGLAGETGEVIEKIKKVMRNDVGVVSDEKRTEITRELGDVLWYLSQLSHELGVGFNRVAEANIAKLVDRAARDVIKGQGDTR